MVCSALILVMGCSAVILVIVAISRRAPRLLCLPRLVATGHGAGSYVGQGQKSGLSVYKGRRRRHDRVRVWAANLHRANRQLITIFPTAILTSAMAMPQRLPHHRTIIANCGPMVSAGYQWPSVADRCRQRVLAAAGEMITLSSSLSSEPTIPHACSPSGE